MSNSYVEGKGAAVPTPKQAADASGGTDTGNHSDMQNSQAPFGGDIYGSSTGHVGSTETSNTVSEAEGGSPATDGS
jgi:hypothetical protein